MRPKLHGKANASKDTCKEDSFIFKYLETLQAISEQLTAGLQQGKRRQRGESCPAQVVTRLLGKSQGATSWRHKSLSRSTRQALGSGISSRSAGESFRRCTPGTAGLLHPATAAGLHGTPWATACVRVCSVPSRGARVPDVDEFRRRANDLHLVSRPGPRGRRSEYLGAGVEGVGPEQRRALPEPAPDLFCQRRAKLFSEPCEWQAARTPVRIRSHRLRAAVCAAACRPPACGWAGRCRPPSARAKARRLTELEQGGRRCIK